MYDSSNPLNAQELLSQMEWLSRLAHRLVSDPALADDAVQDAWLTARKRHAARGLAGPPDRDELGKTLRGTILHALRGARRRRYHEAQYQQARHEETKSAQGEGLPSTEELLAIGEQQRVLWRHLADLDEPYRSTLMLRFQQSLSSAELSARQGVKEDTVRWRTRRGLELLRDSLEREEGGHGLFGLVPVALPLAWTLPPWDVAPALAAGASATSSTGIAGIAGTALTSKTGVLWMTYKGSIGIAAAVAALLAGLIAVRAQQQEAPHSAASAQERAILVGPDASMAGLSIEPQLEGQPAVSEDSASRQPASAGGDSGQEQSMEAAVDEVRIATAVGRVLDEDGRPVSGTQVTVSSHQRWERIGTTDPEGRFEIACPAEPDRRVSLMVEAKDHHGLTFVAFGKGSGCAFPPLELERVDVGDLMVRPAGVATGTVLDEFGTPLEEAIIGGNTHARTTTDARGQFRIEGLSLGSNYLRAYADGFVDGGMSVTLVKGEVLESKTFVLGKESLIHVSGNVVDTEGRPIPGATVQNREHSVEARPDGSFELSFPGDGRLFLTASADSHRKSNNQMCLDGSTIRIVLHPAGAPKIFEVVDKRTDDPIRDAEVRISIDPESELSDTVYGLFRWAQAPESEERTSGPDGRLVARAENGHDLLRVTAPGYQELNTRPVASVGPTGVQVIALERLARAALKGAIPEDVPVPDVTTVEVQILEALEEVTASDGGPVLAVRGRHLIHSDSHRTYRYTQPGKALARIAVRLPEERAAMSEPFLLDPTEEVEVKDLRVVSLGSIDGHINLPHPALASDFMFQLEGTPSGEIELDADGQFHVSGLLPGAYLLAPKRVPDAVEKESFTLVVEVLPGRATAVEIDAGLPPYGEVQVTLEVNGETPPKGMAVQFLKDGERYYDYFDYQGTAPVTLFVPAGNGYRVVVEPFLPGEPNAQCELEGLFDVPPGSSRFDFKVETCTVVCSVGPQYYGKLNRAWQFLLSDTAEGQPRNPVDAGKHVHFDTAPSADYDYIDITFHFVPITATNLRLCVEGRKDDVSLLTLPFEAKLRPGESVRVVLE